MERDYWLLRWREERTGFNQDVPHAALIRYFPNLALSPGARVFVPLCGKSIDMLWIAEQGFNVIGVEFSTRACEAFFVENNLKYKREKIGRFEVFFNENISIFCGDFFDLNTELLGRIDAVYDRAALVALPPETRARYSQKMASLIGVNGKVLLISAAYDQSTMEGPPFSVDEHEITRLFKSDFEITTLKHEPFQSIADHLKAKGLRSADELIMLLHRRANAQASLPH